MTGIRQAVLMRRACESARTVAIVVRWVIEEPDGRVSTVFFPSSSDRVSRFGDRLVSVVGTGATRVVEMGPSTRLDPSVTSVVRRLVEESVGRFRTVFAPFGSVNVSKSLPVLETDRRGATVRLEPLWTMIVSAEIDELRASVNVTRDPPGSLRVCTTFLKLATVSAWVSTGRRVSVELCVITVVGAVCVLDNVNTTEAPFD